MAATAEMSGRAQPRASGRTPLQRHDFGVMRQPVHERNGVRGIRKDRVPFFEGEIRGHHDGFLLIAATDDLKEEISGVRAEAR